MKYDILLLYILIYGVSIGFIIYYLLRKDFIMTIIIIILLLFESFLSKFIVRIGSNLPNGLEWIYIVTIIVSLILLVISYKNFDIKFFYIKILVFMLSIVMLCYSHYNPALLLVIFLIGYNIIFAKRKKILKKIFKKMDNTFICLVNMGYISAVILFIITIFGTYFCEKDGSGNHFQIGLRALFSNDFSDIYLLQKILTSFMSVVLLGYLYKLIENKLFLKSDNIKEDDTVDD